MADKVISKIKINDQYYNIKDAEARTLIESIQNAISNGMHFLGEVDRNETKAIVWYLNEHYNTGIILVDDEYLIGDMWTGAISIRINTTNEIDCFMTKSIETAAPAFLEDVGKTFTYSDVVYTIRSINIFDSGDFFISHLDGNSVNESKEYVYSDFDDCVHSLGYTGQQYEFTPEGTVILTKSEKILKHNIGGTYTPSGEINVQNKTVVNSIKYEKLETVDGVNSVSSTSKAIQKGDFLTDVALSKNNLVTNVTTTTAKAITGITSTNTISHKASYEENTESLNLQPINSIGNFNVVDNNFVDNVTVTSEDITVTKTTGQAVEGIYNAGDTQEAKTVITTIDSATRKFATGKIDNSSADATVATSHLTADISATFTGNEVSMDDVITIGDHSVETVDKATFEGIKGDIQIKQ